MKKIFILTALVFCTCAVFAQGGYTRPNMSYGTRQFRTANDSTTFFPTGCGLPSLRGYDLHMGAIFYDSCNHKMYVYDPAAALWHRADSSGGGGSTQTLQQVLNTGSTLGSQINSVIVQNGFPLNFNENNSSNPVLILDPGHEYAFGDRNNDYGMGYIDALKFASHNDLTIKSPNYSNVTTPLADSAGIKVLTDSLNAGLVGIFGYDVRNHLHKYPVPTSGITAVNANAPLSASGTTTRTVSADTTKTTPTSLVTQNQMKLDSIALAATTATKQPQLNGTGFVKATGTTITYDNTSYGTGTVTSVGTGYGLSGGAITTTGTLIVDSATLSNYYKRQKDSANAITGYTTLYQNSLKQNLVTLTTAGTSGVSTFNQSTGALNIPSYSGTTYSAGLGLLLTSTIFKLDTAYGKKYFLPPLLVPNDSTVAADTSIGPSHLATQNYVLTHSGGSGFDTSLSYTLTGQKWNYRATVVGTAADQRVYQILNRDSLVAFSSRDTLAGLVLSNVFNSNSQAGIIKVDMLTNSDIMVNNVTVGAGNNNNQASQNTAFGYRAGLAYNNAATSGNTAVGSDAGKVVSSGFLNTFVGVQAGQNTSTGNYNSAIGGSSMGGTSSGLNQNTFSGANSGFAATGDNNAGIGFGAGRAGANRNTYLGALSGNTTATGSDNVAIGYASGQFTGDGLFYLANKPTATVQTLLYGNFANGQLLVNPATTPALTTSAQLEIKSTTRGLLPPVQTTTQKNAISSPATGLLVFDSTIKKNAVYDGSQWTQTLTGYSGSFSGAGTATTTFTVTIGATLSNTSYQIFVTPSNILSAAAFYVTNQTTTTFDVVYLAGLTGTVSFHWAVLK